MQPKSKQGEDRVHEIFLFLTFFNNILILTRIKVYLHHVARLITPMKLARQVASVVPVHVARQDCHAGARCSAAPRLH